MNIVFILGNGFDLNIGLNTSYLDFYSFYKNTPSSTSLIKKFKNEISADLENWSDLEKSFGEYTSKLNSKNEFFEVFYDVVDNLSEFIGQQQFDVLFNSGNVNKINVC